MLYLSRTSRASHAAVRAHVARHFNVHPHLSRFFASPQAFRALQERTGTLVSGSTAPPFFARTHYAGADLDLYCAYAARAAVGWWLAGRAGYTFRPTRRQDAWLGLALDEARPPGTPVEDDRYGNLNGISAVYCFTRRVQDAHGGHCEVEVQLIVAYLSPMEAVLSFHSTAVLNVISYAHAYALYPRATLEERLALVLLDDRRVRRGVREKYRRRGYTITGSVFTPQPSPAGDAADNVGNTKQDREADRCVARCFPEGLRWIGDRHSWVLPLRADGAAHLPPVHSGYGAAVSLDPCSVTTWEMVRRGWGRRILAESVEPVGFGQSYVVSDPRLRDAMNMIQKLYVDVPRLPDDNTKYCHEEFMRWCKRMLEDEQMWEIWYPDGRAEPEGLSDNDS